MSTGAEKKPVGSHERKGIKTEMEVPVNLERVLLEAAQDAAFYRALIADRARALAEKGYQLRASEQAMLSALPQTALDKMVERLKPEKLKKSTFAKQVVTALAGSLLISTSACDSEDPKPMGITPDWPDGGGAGRAGNVAVDGGTSGVSGTPMNTGGMATTGIRSDWPAGGGGSGGAGSAGSSGSAGNAGGAGSSGSAGSAGSSGSAGSAGSSGSAGSAGSSGSVNMNTGGMATKGIGSDWPAGAGGKAGSGGQ
jgi:hypothetical protein